MLANNLKKLHLPASLIKEALQKCRIKPGLRPEQLTISQFVELFHFFYPSGKKNSAIKRIISPPQFS